MKTIFKIKLTLVIMLFSIYTSFAQQPLVRVPPSCNVVVPGAGGSPGLGGKVGDGGIVCMPDPFDDATVLGDFTYLPVNVANVLTGWSLRGDLSVQTANVPPATGTYSAGALTTLNIESYNKNLRVLSEGTLPSQSKWARSKGRVTVSYTAAPCNNSITFEIFKQFAPNAILPVQPNNIPAIIGPNCVEPNKIYTYSVDQIVSDNAGDAIGFDSYYWSGLPAGATGVYSSADKSSITFTTGSTVAPFTIKCCYGRCNPWDSDGVYTATPVPTTCVSKDVKIVPVQPTFTSAQPLGCLNTGATSFVVTLTAIAGQSYSWSAPGTSWNLAPSGTPSGQTLTVSAIDNNPGTLLLTINNGSCQPVVFQYTINRNFVAPSASISSPTCLVAGSTTNTFSIQTNASLNPTSWTLPSGWSITPGSANGTNSVINVTVPAGTAAGSYTVSAKSVSCPGVITRTVFVKPSAPIFTAGSPLCVTRGTTPITTIAVTPIVGVPTTGYSWTPLPAGWTCTANCNTANPTLVPNGTTAGPVTLTVTATSGTGCSTSSTRTINYNPVAPNSITTSCWSFGVAGTTTVTVANAPVPFFGTYVVSSTPSGLFGSYSVNPTTGVITLNTLATASGTYTLIISHSTTSCGSSTISFPGNNVTGNGSSVAITANVPGVNNCDQYTVSSAPLGSTYAWFVSGTQVFSNGSTVNIFGNTLTLCGNGTAPTSVCVNVTSNGCTTRLCLLPPVTGTHSARQDNESTPKSIIDGVIISPNPNTGNFSIKVDNFKENAEAVLTDINGKEIANYTLQKGENKIHNDNLSKGTYLVILKIDGKQEARKIIIK